jgi:hypothetical protein
MTRLFTIFLLLLLPLQFSLAAASAYCVDETEVRSEHFGHHEHNGDKELAVDNQNIFGSDPVEKLSADTSCHLCHAAFANVPVIFAALGSLGHDLPKDVSPSHRAPQHQTTPLQRPPIVSLA